MQKKEKEEREERERMFEKDKKRTLVLVGLDSTASLFHYLDWQNIGFVFNPL
jgi:hypothetical protein